jgi:hypothetical protein
VWGKEVLTAVKMWRRAVTSETEGWEGESQLRTDKDGRREHPRYMRWRGVGRWVRCGSNVSPRVGTTGDGGGVDRPGVDVKRYGGTWGVEDEGR